MARTSLAGSGSAKAAAKPFPRGGGCTSDAANVAEKLDATPQDKPLESEHGLDEQVANVGAEEGVEPEDESLESQHSEEDMKALLHKVMLGRAAQTKEHGTMDQNLSDHDGPGFFVCPVMVIFAAKKADPMWQRPVCLNACHLPQKDF